MCIIIRHLQQDICHMVLYLHAHFICDILQFLLFIFELEHMLFKVINLDFVTQIFLLFV
jgi:hypothetical protein